MKLISLYIENFGGLSRYELDFADGLTVIEAENGFGKTTMAEFIRAMFYGFPRKGKTLDKSRRQKYTPWNGGKFGGNLVFELDGIRYRLERSFGATPKGDSFSLIELNTGKKSSRFTEEIGLELFGLDGDAFERSTYLPQMGETGSLTTDSIRSKLSNLVEDTNDVGNFEKAVAALKSKRSTYVPYRGSGGSVSQAQSRISQLQEQLNLTLAKEPPLEACGRSIAELENAISTLQTECDQIRTRIRTASEAAAVAAAHRQEQQMLRKREETEDQLQQLREKYPAGLPDAEELEQSLRYNTRLEMLKGRAVTDPEDLEAEAFLNSHRDRFTVGIPSREALEEYREVCRQYYALAAEAEGKGLSQSEKEQEARLADLFSKGLLEKERLEVLAKANREWEEKGHQRSVLELSQEDHCRKQALEIYFAAGIPDEMTLRQKNEDLEQLRQLQQAQSQRIAAAAQMTAGNTSPVLMILLLILGIVAAAVGIAMMGQSVLVGGIGLGIGVLCLIGGILAGVRLKKNRELEKEIRAQREAIGAADEQIRKLRESIEQFALSYSTNDMLAAALYEIRDNREDYLALLAKQRQLEEKQRILDGERDGLEQFLRKELGEVDYAEEILNLRLLREQYLDLQNQKKQAEEEAAQLREKAAQLLQKIRSFLTSYGISCGEDLYGALAELERTADAYIRAKTRVQRWQEQKQQHELDLAESTEALAAFFARIGLKPDSDIARQLLRIRDDRKTFAELAHALDKLDCELEAFREENKLRLAEKLPDVLENPEELREEEIRKNRQLREETERLLQLQQEQRQLKSAVAQLPALQEDLQVWVERKIADQRSADILDDTVAFLDQAKENLSVSYLGPIRGSFNGYLSRLWGDQAGKTLVNQDLDVLLERYGESWELGYFSAGQTDLVMLCMRFALVDALFGENSPCVILDDPFVNLDDRHSRLALELLEELAQRRQILYLTWSTSRTPN